jgi:hypothetical protein
MSCRICPSILAADFSRADVLPQVIGPAFAPLLLALGPGRDYAALYLFAMAISLLGVASVTRIETVR